MRTARSHAAKSPGLRTVRRAMTVACASEAINGTSALLRWAADAVSSMNTCRSSRLRNDGGSRRGRGPFHRRVSHIGRTLSASLSYVQSSKIFAPLAHHPARPARKHERKKFFFPPRRELFRFSGNQNNYERSECRCSRQNHLDFGELAR